ncbi:uncharacterized protein Ibf1 isoform X2 [Drosophila pseudoobscura]|uniref:Uncharacterized protein Ibf1 isoform X2 n=1 Tax=Drosophila pseudoobscura pseudoobscura TaxID=46245 RepID=A0A6I8VNG9_DROPS|nr:uncharacterized protein LOC4800357 isoform X2 [Drosophila pseudoobscura]
MPRKKSEDFYKKFGFSAKCENGKYTATCTFCNKELQNTALTRLSLHRQTCDQKRALSETQSINMERARPVLKIHKITHEDADGGIDHGNEGKEIIVKQSLDDPANGTDTNFGENRPKNNLALLKADKARAEIKQYNSKAMFLRTETENLKLERTLTLLKIQKLRLEIDCLRAQS